MPVPLRPRPLFLTLLLTMGGATGCEGEGPAHLAEASSLEMSVTWNPRYDTAVMSVQTTPECAPLGPQGQATFNGVPMVVEARGGLQPGSFPFTRYCAVPNFLLHERSQAPAGEDGATSFVVEDGGQTWKMVVNDYGVERQLRVVEPTEEILVVGQRVSLEWSEPTESLHPDFTFLRITPVGSESRSLVLRGAELDVSGRSLGFTVPELGADEVVLSVFHSEVTGSRCEGPTRCVLRIPANRQMPVRR